MSQDPTKDSSVVIVLAEDDEDDYLLIKKAFQDSHLLNELKWVQDGEVLMDYLHHRGDYADAGKAPRPGLILLDLNMPRKDGREALKEIKSDPNLRKIPVVVLTTSKAEEDIIKTYDLGANSFIKKPVDFQQFLNVIRVLNQYWLQVVRLPSDAK